MWLFGFHPVTWGHAPSHALFINTVPATLWFQSSPSIITRLNYMFTVFPWQNIDFSWWICHRNKQRGSIVASNTPVIDICRASQAYLKGIFLFLHPVELVGCSGGFENIILIWIMETDYGKAISTAHVCNTVPFSRYKIGWVGLAKYWCIE